MIMQEINTKIQYRRIAFAGNFSSKLGEYLREVAFLKKKFRAELVLVIFGKESTEINTIKNILTELSLDLDKITIHWESQQNLDKVTEFINKYDIDLLLFSYFSEQKKVLNYISRIGQALKSSKSLDNFGKKLIRKSKTSLLFLNPTTSVQAQKILLNIREKGDEKFLAKNAFYWTRLNGLVRLDVLKEVKMMDLSLLLDGKYNSEEEDKYEQLENEIEAVRKSIKRYKPRGLNLEVSLASHKVGYKIVKKAKQEEVDLLVLSLNDFQNNTVERMFASGLDHILNHIPCNLLFVYNPN